MLYPEAMRSYPPGNYARYIHDNYINNLGFDLSSIGQKIITIEIAVDLQGEELINSDILRNSFGEIIDFINTPSSTRYDNVVWYKMNIPDHAINEYMGIGSFKLENDYLKFILSYLSIERAAEAGDTIIVLFDKDFNWAVEFTLNQEDKNLTAVVYDSRDRKPKVINHAK